MIPIASSDGKATSLYAFEALIASVGSLRRILLEKDHKITVPPSISRIIDANRDLFLKIAESHKPDEVVAFSITRDIYYPEVKFLGTIPHKLTGIFHVTEESIEWTSDAYSDAHIKYVHDYRYDKPPVIEIERGGVVTRIGAPESLDKVKEVYNGWRDIEEKIERVKDLFPRLLPEEIWRVPEWRTVRLPRRLAVYVADSRGYQGRTEIFEYEDLLIVSGKTLKKLLLEGDRSIVVPPTISKIIESNREKFLKLAEIANPDDVYFFAVSYDSNTGSYRVGCVNRVEIPPLKIPGIILLSYGTVIEHTSDVNVKQVDYEVVEVEGEGVRARIGVGRTDSLGLKNTVSDVIEADKVKTKYELSTSEEDVLKPKPTEEVRKGLEAEAKATFKPLVESVKPLQVKEPEDVKKALDEAAEVGSEIEKEVIDSLLPVAAQPTLKPQVSTPWYRFLRDVNLSVADSSVVPSEDSVRTALSLLRDELRDAVLAQLRSGTFYVGGRETRLAEALGVKKGELEKIADEVVDKLLSDSGFLALVRAGVSHIRYGVSQLPERREVYLSYKHAIRLNGYVTATILEVLSKRVVVDTGRLGEFKKKLVDRSATDIDELERLSRSQQPAQAPVAQGKPAKAEQKKVAEEEKLQTVSN